jgi:hypothetical protein
MAEAKHSFVKIADVSRLQQEILLSPITVRLSRIDFSAPSKLDVYFMDALPTGQYDLLAALVGKHVATPLPADPSPKLNKDGVQLVDVTLKKGGGGSGVTFVSHDFSDRTTWYQKSIRIYDVPLTAESENVYASAHRFWIDIFSKKLIFHRNRVAKRTGDFGKHGDWGVVVKKDGIVLKSSEYRVDFREGKVAILDGKPGKVTATYSHNDGVSACSEYILMPRAGEKYTIDHVELQFDTEVIFTSPVRFQVWAGSKASAAGIAGYGGFLDAYYDAGYGQMSVDYQDIRGIINQANLGTGSIPAMHGAGIENAVAVMPFDYIKSIELSGNICALVRMLVLDDAELENSDITTASFYIEVTKE